MKGQKEGGGTEEVGEGGRNGGMEGGGGRRRTERGREGSTSSG